MSKFNSDQVNPYKEFFSYGKNEKGKYIYVKDTDFEDILKINKIDEEFCTAMYSYIGTFEKKFKTVLFNEICLKYINCDNPDYTCTSYVDEIDEFVKTGDMNKLPRFCVNFPYTLTKKGYLKDTYDINKKKDVLIHIKELGIGFKEDGTKIDKTNKLIAHYLKKQNIVPLWVIPNALTLGELKILFSMLDSKSQKNIVGKFYEFKENRKIEINDVINFSGTIELIRRIRNIVNHYEPIFPLLIAEIKAVKKIETSQIFKVLKFLHKTFELSSFNNINLSNLNIEPTNFNTKHLKTLELMKKFIEK